MASALDLLLAAGRGDNPSEAGGILIVVGIAVAVLVGGFMLLMAWLKFGRARRDARRRPHEPGKVGRSSEFR